MPSVGKIRFFTIGLANFIAQYHHYLIAFILSTFLASFVGEQALGYVVAAASLMTTLILISAPSVFTAFGIKNVLGFLALAEVAVLLGMAVAESPIMAVTLFVLQGVLTMSMFIGIDLLVESQTTNEKTTGNARGIILTISNISALLATYTLSMVAVDDQYYRIFITSALVLLPLAAIAFQGLPSISHIAPPKAALLSTVFAQIRANRSLRIIILAHFLLQLFFQWMVIYSPLLLHDYVHFSWSEIGLLLTLAMVPYIVLEYPLGWIADAWLGEKEILITGFVVLACSTLVMALIDGVPFWIWATVMVVSRIGAAMVEVMTETHFFKQVTHEDPAAIGTFRMLRPLGGVVAPLIASAALVFLPLPLIFGVFAVIIASGIPLAFSIVDSK